ncbi:hypothetical protein JQ628_11240 [Bradyrhizobium lablabi]|uniref:DUF6378 domain-containing protein n=1 Tax=Bradyrhizobium lablabi TaxID=722472 RepID=UPI001BAB825B|nr:DUF6378 domain-containing protein [Bradyrhizobium lablabi]MBR1122090.1 hypothetical protein [Bradyrhizobium lablabi]
MQAVELIAKAQELVGGDRAKTHGDKHRNFANIALYWNAYIQTKGGKLLDASDVGHMMALLKIARTQSGEVNPDDAIDAIGYIACAGEIAAAKR